MNILFLSYIMDAYYVKLRYYKMCVCVCVLRFKAQLITDAYLNRKTLNLIIKNYPKQQLKPYLNGNLNSIIKNNLNY